MLVSWTKQGNQNATSIMILSFSISGPLRSWDIKDRLFCSQILTVFLSVLWHLPTLFWERLIITYLQYNLFKFMFWPMCIQLTNSPFLIPTSCNHLPLSASTLPNHFLYRHNDQECLALLSGEKGIFIPSLALKFSPSSCILWIL